MTARHIELAEGTVVDIDSDRPLTRFMLVTTGPVALRLSYSAALAIHELMDPLASALADEPVEPHAV